MQFFEDNETQIEKTLSRIFPNSEICSIVLHSAVNLWGYAVTQNGQIIRARAGSADDGTFVEIGEPLEEEKELLSKSKLDDNGNRIYFLNDSLDEPFNEDQVGENYVFSICKRYFGEELDRADDLLFETTLTGYSFQTSTKRYPGVKDKKKSNWITYLIIFLLILIWQILKRTIFKD
jgi:hypothetical protein